MQTSKQIKQLSYLFCPKSDQPLNLICLQPKCLDRLINCCVCIESNHKNHNIKPLKYVINEARSNSPNIKVPKWNNDILLDLVNKNKQLSLEVFQTHKKDIIVSLQKIEQSITAYYNSIIQEIICNSSDNNLMIDQMIYKAMNANNIQDLQKMIKKIVVLLPNYNNIINKVTEKDVVHNISFSSTSMRQFSSDAFKQINTKFRQFQKNMIDMIDKSHIWKSSSKIFIQDICHPQLSIISSTRIKSDKTNGYKFAILDPHFQKSNIQTFSLKIVQSSNSWLGIGLCHKNIVLSKKFGFTFGSTGHGAYLIGANGSSWSHNRADLNNTVKAFKFETGDTVKITLNKSSKQILFELNNKGKYSLPYEPIQDDPLHGCVLFYYKNDEVQYISPNSQ